MQPVNIFWFRRDLRLDDNAGLYHALKSGKKVVPVFIFDTNILDRLEDRADRRVDFIRQALEQLNSELHQYGSSLHVYCGTPPEAFKQITGKFVVEAVYCNHDYEPYALQRDEEIKNLLAEKNCTLHSFKDQCIFEKEEVVKDDGDPYTVFTPYARKWRSKLNELYLSSFPGKKYFGNFLPAEKRGIPSLKAIGFEKTDLKFALPGINTALIRNYNNTRDIPFAEGTSKLGVHLRFGTISIRKLAREALKLNETFMNELAWREFYMMILFHFPHVEKSSFRKAYDRIKWRDNEQEFRLWCEGKTGYPLVDAGMRELNATGFMHNRVRMVTASFLVKHLLVDWRWGEAYFARKLLDFDLSANNGNWQWAAGCGCDAAPYFRVFNPLEQQKKFDPEFKYIRRWIKEFDSMEYPAPIVEHRLARERAIRTYKEIAGK